MLEPPTRPGFDHHEDYKPPFPLTAKLNKLTIKVDRPRLSPADIQKLETAQRINKMSE